MVYTAEDLKRGEQRSAKARRRIAIGNFFDAFGFFPPKGMHTKKMIRLIASKRYVDEEERRTA